MTNFSKINVPAAISMTIFLSSLSAIASAKSERRAELLELTAEIQMQPTRAILYAQRGQAYIDLKDWANALKDTNKAIDLSPENISFLVARAAIYDVIGKFDSEQSDLEKAVALNPKDVQALKYLAVFYASNKKNQRQQGCSTLLFASRQNLRTFIC